MGKKNPLLNAYIEKQKPFARPILKKVRALFHKACPDVEESIKWGHASFSYHGILGGMAAFKEHVAWGMWKSALLKDKNGVLLSDASSFMGSGKPKDVSELPKDALIIQIIKEAMKLNEDGLKLPSRANARKRPAPKTPADLAAALKKSPKAAATFEAFSPSCKREYVEWLTEAKQAETRARRLTQAVEWMTEGKQRNWKYMNCKK